MRLVNANDVKSCDKIYSLIPQPMTIYHSTEEFNQNERNIPNTIIAESFDELLKIFRENNIDLTYFGLSNDARYKDLRHLNLWIKTVDKFVPDYADLAGQIFYVVDANQGFIPTDACYVRCYFVVPLPAKFILICSSGINSVSITKWQPTAAVRTQFLYEYDKRKALGSEAVYQETLNKLLMRVKPNVDMYKFLFAFLNKDAPSFLDLDKSSAMTFGAKIHKADRYKILQSPMFARAIMEVLKIIMPELKTEAKKQFPPEKLISMLAEAAGFAKDDKNVKDILTVFDKIADLGYGGVREINDTTKPDIPLIGEQKVTGQLEAPDSQKERDEFFDDLRDETDAMESFVTLDTEEDEEQIKE